MKQLFMEIEKQLKLQHDVMLVTIIASSGSTPRGPGARMVVKEKGRLWGTIGGGALECKAIQIAMESLSTNSSRICHFCLARSEVEDLGMICGGDITVQFRYISHMENDFYAFMDHLRYLYQQNETCWLLTSLSEKNLGDLGLYGIHSGLFGLYPIKENVILELDGRTQTIQIDGNDYYAEELIHAGRVYIFGGGHVAQELVPMLSHVGFHCVVADDRPEFASKALFPDAEQTILVDFKEIKRDISLTENDAVCVMTRGHAYDAIVQLQVLKEPIFYIGVIGSIQKTASIAKLLREQGFGEDKIASIHTPIGLPIGAETPAEIAVSITAELILERTKRLKSIRIAAT